MASYLRLTLRTAAAREEILGAELWESGTLGFESRKSASGQVEVRAYFAAGNGLDAAALAAREAREGVEIVACEALEQTDWLSAYRARVLPIEVGSRLVVDPREPGEPAPATGGRRLLRLPARTAYGTGSHESTRMALEYLESLPLAGARVLDVGSGSGILSFAALLFGARFVVGVEIDREAALVGGQNRALNDLWPSLVAGGLEAVAPGARFDVAVANILPGSFLHQVPLLAERLVAAGVAIFAGIPEERAAEVEARLRECGLEIRDRRLEGEWVALRSEAAAG